MTVHNFFGMKKILLIILSLTIVANGFGQLYSLFSYPSSVDLFGLCEISFKLSATYSNPYDPDIISVYAVFTGPDNSSYTVNAFYYEDYTFQKHNTGYEVATHNSLFDGWRIRFTPDKVGTWTFMITATDINGNLNRPFLNVNYTFSCTSVSNADGFISKANSRFLKRDIVRNGQRQFHSFFPIGPDIAWYSCKKDTLYPEYFKPYGIYEYKKFIDSLDGNANYMRVFLSQFQYLSLFGPEYTQLDNNGQPIVYFNNTVNQKDSAELDYIITYAKEHGVTIMPCMFNYTNFTYNDSPTSWENNPFNNVLDGPCYFFTDQDAIKITKNLIRYIISRWGYATNIVSWEFWNEVFNLIDDKVCYKNIDHDIQNWHDEMAEYVAGIDPFNHCITTSTGNISEHEPLYQCLFYSFDIVQLHNYQNIQKAKSKEQISYILYSKTDGAHSDYPSHPFFMGEFGFGQTHSTPSYFEKDPCGIDLHNSLWSSTFSSSMGPASFWWWYYLDINGLFCRYRPMLHFLENMPILSETFTPHQTGHIDGHKLVFPNNLETYYMINSAEDTIYGWSQDTAFAYQSLRWLTDYVIPPSQNHSYHFVIENGVFDPLGYVYTLNEAKKPGPSSNNNTISLKLSNQPVGKTYRVQWYNSETGYTLNTGATQYATVQQNAQGEKTVSFQFPSQIRNLQQQTITNRFGDAVFSLILFTPPEKTK